MTQTRPLSLHDVLDRIDLNETPDFMALARLTAEHPHLAAELADFYAAWGLQEVEPDDAPLNSDRFARESMNRALARFDARAKARQPAPPASLAELIVARGQDSERVALACQLTAQIVIDLGNGRIDTTTTPPLCVGAIARALKAEPQEVLRMLAAAPDVGPDGEAPMSFVEAILAASSLPRDDARIWLSAAKERVRSRR